MSDAHWTQAMAEAAKAATPGPWGVWKGHAEVKAGITSNSPGQVHYRRTVANCESDADENDGGAKRDKRNAAHIAACYPERILALLRVAEAARKRALHSSGHELDAALAAVFDGEPK
jgi:hypothetical protein